MEILWVPWFVAIPQVYAVLIIIIFFFIKQYAWISNGNTRINSALKK